MKTIIAGTRTITGHAALTAVCDAMDAAAKEGIVPTEIVSGCARGIDKCGELWADTEGLPVRHFPADWKRYGKAAGPTRNREMAGYAQALVAVWDGVSVGTRHMIAVARSCGLRVYVHMVRDAG